MLRCAIQITAGTKKTGLFLLVLRSCLPVPSAIPPSHLLCVHGKVSQASVSAFWQGTLRDFLLHDPLLSCPLYESSVN